MRVLRYIRNAVPGWGGSRLAVAAYVATWLVGAAVAAGLLVVALDDGDGGDVTLPPVRETELGAAASRAGCELRRAGAGERLNPPVAGPATAPAAQPGFYDEEPPRLPSLVSALRVGVVVIHYREDVDQALLDILRDLQAVVPAGTIVAREQTGMPFEVAVTSYRRLLGCRRFDTASLDAVRLFRGRFVGSGPDA